MHGLIVPITGRTRPATVRLRLPCRSRVRPRGGADNRYLKTDVFWAPAGLGARPARSAL